MRIPNTGRWESVSWSNVPVCSSSPSTRRRRYEGLGAPSSERDRRQRAPAQAHPASGWLLGCPDQPAGEASGQVREVRIALTVEQAEALLPWRGEHSIEEWNRRQDAVEDAYREIRAELRKVSPEQPDEQERLV